MFTKKRTGKGFTLIELLVVLSIIGLIASATLSYLFDTRLNAHDKLRMAELARIQDALQLYEKDHGYFPREAEGANGNIATNEKFLEMLRPYLPRIAPDPAGVSDSTYYYYYDGAAQCGSEKAALLFAREMDKASNSNYAEFLKTTCAGVLDGEGRGGGTESYNIKLGKTGG